MLRRLYAALSCGCPCLPSPPAAAEPRLRRRQHAVAPPAPKGPADVAVVVKHMGGEELATVHVAHGAVLKHVADELRAGGVIPPHATAVFLSQGHRQRSAWEPVSACTGRRTRRGKRKRQRQQRVTGVVADEPRWALGWSKRSRANGILAWPADETGDALPHPDAVCSDSATTTESCRGVSVGAQPRGRRGGRRCVRWIPSGQQAHRYTTTEIAGFGTQQICRDVKVGALRRVHKSLELTVLRELATSQQVPANKVDEIVHILEGLAEVRA